MKLDEFGVPADAEERSWRVVSAAFSERVPAPRRHFSRPSLTVAVTALAVGLAITTAAVSASGGSVLNTVRDALGVRNAAPLLLRLPSAGRVLVNSSSGPWIVSADGSKRHLGGRSLAQTGWSPHGLFEVTVVDGNELAAIDPKGAVRWTLARPAIEGPRWSGDGFRIAYRSRGALRVVAGDGTGDHRLSAAVAPVAPAWEGTTHELAYTDLQGRIHVVDADTGAARWVSAPGPLPTSIAWQPDGSALVEVTAGALRVLHGSDGTPAGTIPLGPGFHSFAISSDGVAAVTSNARGRQSSILLVHPGEPTLAPKPIFHGAGAFDGLAWSPDGRWLLASWTSADQWVFIELGGHPGAATRVQAVSSIAHAFEASIPPSLAGWCCAQGPPPT